MVKSTYSREAPVPVKSCKARGDDLRVSFKNTFETAAAIRGMTLKHAQDYLNAVMEHKECVPFRRFYGGVGRKAQAKKYGINQGRYPEKSCRFLLNLLKNVEANADNKGLDVSSLVVWHIQVNRAMKGRRRTYKAHGGIKPYLSQNCHVELICAEKPEAVPKGALGA